MNSASIQSARYATASAASDAPVIAIRDSGDIEYRRADDDIEGGGMLAFLASGGKIDPWIEPELEAEPVPSSITPLQARNGLRQWGIGRGEISAFFATIADPVEREKAEDAWEYATQIDRVDPLIAQCAGFLDKTPAEIDQFFRDAVAR